MAIENRIYQVPDVLLQQLLESLQEQAPEGAEQREQQAARGLFNIGRDIFLPMYEATVPAQKREVREVKMESLRSVFRKQLRITEDTPGAEDTAKARNALLFVTGLLSRFHAQFSEAGDLLLDAYGINQLLTNLLADLRTVLSRSDTRRADQTVDPMLPHLATACMLTTKILHPMHPRTHQYKTVIGICANPPDGFAKQLHTLSSAAQAWFPTQKITDTQELTLEQIEAVLQSGQ